jgi:hypothetical protein
VGDVGGWLGRAGDVLLAVLPWALWCVWWLCAVNWGRLWPVLGRGSWAPVVLLMILAALAWSRMDPSHFAALRWERVDPVSESQPFLLIPPFWWHLGAVSLLVALALFCGFLQGVLGWAPEELSLEPPAVAHDHGHGAGHPHGYDDAHH